MGSIQAMRDAAQKINSSDIGYDQSERWTFWNGKGIVPHKECDCSSCCGVIAKLGGYNVNLSGDFYTGNFCDRLKAAGFSVIRFTKLSDVRRGDFLVKSGRHVEFVYDVDRFFSAHQDERGKASGGKAGNQTGKEVSFSNAYNYVGGWEFICRPPADSAGGAYVKAYAGSATSLADALESVGADGSKESRTKLAAANGIKGYAGTAEQNGTLLRLLKSGRLKR